MRNPSFWGTPFMESIYSCMIFSSFLMFFSQSHVELQLVPLASSLHVPTSAVLPAQGKVASGLPIHPCHMVPFRPVERSASVGHGGTLSLDGL